ncbi:uncharacterized protein TNCT_103971 [Trichonephila clavata]|uniref:Uncharacterized protein n=1 Tax=Trichonephila clavata TaxID=2740835 RepID=A0A8X6FIP8_TRICU|nr:uncharacterized protein TNCT_103971 [Trichonephila clavata]
MNRLPIQVLVLSVIAISNVIAYKGYDDDFVDFNRKTDMCVNKAKDQELCDEFLHCKTKLPKPLEKNFNKCINKVYPDGSFGTCNDDTSLYQSSDKLNKYLNCLSEKSSLDEDGKKQYEVYKQCLHKVCDKCMKNN